MLGEYFDEEYDSNIKDIFNNNEKVLNPNNNNNQNDLLEFSANKSGGSKKDKIKKKKKKAICENCKALNQKINELDQLNMELLKIKEKLSQENEELFKKNEELTKNNINITNQNNELILVNKKLKGENEDLINKNNTLTENNNKLKEELNSKLNDINELNKKQKVNQNTINKNNELIENNNKIKKELNSKLNDINELNKKQKENQNININKKNEIKSNNISNNESIIPNKELIYSKKKEAINLSKFCSIEDFNKLKLVVEELQTKINNLEKWKKTMENIPKEKKEFKNIDIEMSSNEKNIKEINQKSIKKEINNNINNKDEDKILPNNIKKIIEEDKIQKIRNKFQSEDNSSSDELNDSNNNSNTRTEHNNYNYFQKLKNINQNQRKNFEKKELSLKVKRIPSKKKESKENEEAKLIPLPKNSNIINKSYINIATNKNIIPSHKEKPKHKNQKFNSKIITNLEDLDLIARGLAQDDIDSLRNLRVLYKLIYRASEHGGEAEIFHERCDDFEGTLVIIKTKDDNMFGGYTKLSWDEEDGKEKRDENAFVFSINLEKLYFYFYDEKKFNIFCDKNKGPCFVGMFSVPEQILKGKGLVDKFGIQCYEGENNKYEINGGKNEFFIEEMEVFQVIIKTN